MTAAARKERRCSVKVSM